MSLKKITCAEILEALKTPHAWSALADDVNYHLASHMVEREIEFEQAGIPDPCVLRAWWEGLCDIPPSYRPWVDAGVLIYIGTECRGPYEKVAGQLERVESLLKYMREHEQTTEVNKSPETPVSPPPANEDTAKD